MRRTIAPSVVRQTQERAAFVSSPSDNEEDVAETEREDDGKSESSISEGGAKERHHSPSGKAKAKKSTASLKRALPLPPPPSSDEEEEDPYAKVEAKPLHQKYNKNLIPDDELPFLKQSFLSPSRSTSPVPSEATSTRSDDRSISVEEEMIEGTASAIAPLSVNISKRKRRKSSKRGEREDEPWIDQEEAIVLYWHDVEKRAISTIANKVRRSETSISAHIDEMRPLSARMRERLALKQKISLVSPAKTARQLWINEAGNVSKSGWNKLTSDVQNKFRDKAILDKKRYEDELNALGVSKEQLRRFQQLTLPKGFKFRGKEIAEPSYYPYIKRRPRGEDESILEYATDVILPLEKRWREKQAQVAQVPVWLNLPPAVSIERGDSRQLRITKQKMRKWEPINLDSIPQQDL